MYKLIIHYRLIRFSFEASKILFLNVLRPSRQTHFKVSFNYLIYLYVCTLLTNNIWAHNLFRNEHKMDINNL